MCHLMLFNVIQWLALTLNLWFNGVIRYLDALNTIQFNDSVFLLIKYFKINFRGKPSKRRVISFAFIGFFNVKSVSGLLTNAFICGHLEVRNSKIDEQ